MNKPRLVRIADVCDTSSGGTPSRRNSSYYRGDIAWIKSGELNKEYIEDTEEKITLDGLNNSSAKFVEPNTVLIAMYGATVGAVAITKIKATTNQAVCAVVPKDDSLNYKYLYYFLKSIRQDLINKSVGGAQPNISQKIIRDTYILVPDIKTQEKIVIILEKSEKLKQRRLFTNQNTQTLIQELFHEIFGDLVKNEKEWEMKLLGDCFEILRGGSPRPIQKYLTTSANGINWIKIGDTKGNSKYILTTEEKIIPEGSRKSRKVKQGDFILSNSMSFGRPYIVQIDGCIHDGWLLIRDVNKLVSPDYLYSVLRTDYVQKQFIASTSGSTVQNLKIDVVKKVKIPLPPLSLQENFARKVRIIEKIQSKQESSTVEINNLFDALMQKAFKGELVI